MYERPKDALIYIDSSWYKLGLRGFVYLFIDGEWVRSSRTKEELKQEWMSQFDKLLKEKCPELGVLFAGSGWSRIDVDVAFKKIIKPRIKKS